MSLTLYALDNDASSTLCAKCVGNAIVLSTSELAGYATELVTQPHNLITLSDCHTLLYLVDGMSVTDREALRPHACAQRLGEDQ